MNHSQPSSIQNPVSSIEYRVSRIEQRIMQNKPNFRKSQMNINSLFTRDYENKSNWTLGENKPNSNPIKPNFRKAQMNVNSLITKDYRKNDDFAVQKNKPNSNPIQTQSKPILERMNVNFCVTGYYESKQKALKKPPLLEVNSEPLSKDWRNV